MVMAWCDHRRGLEAARFLQLCDTFAIPVVSLIYCPGDSGRMGRGVEVLRAARPGWVGCWGGTAGSVGGGGCCAQATVGAQAMTVQLTKPLLTVAWPSAHLGPMGLEGAVRLGLRKELEAIADDDDGRVRQATAIAQENAKALNAAQIFEIDDVIDPAETLGTDRRDADRGGRPRDLPPLRRFVDTW